MISMPESKNVALTNNWYDKIENGVCLSTRYDKENNVLERICLSTRSNKANKKERFLIQKWVFDHELLNPNKVWKSKEYNVWSKEKSIFDEAMVQC